MKKLILFFVIFFIVCSVLWSGNEFGGRICNANKDTCLTVIRNNSSIFSGFKIYVFRGGYVEALYAFLFDKPYALIFPNFDSVVVDYKNDIVLVYYSGEIDGKYAANHKGVVLNEVQGEPCSSTNKIKYGYTSSYICAFFPMNEKRE